MERAHNQLFCFHQVASRWLACNTVQSTVALCRSANDRAEVCKLDWAFFAVIAAMVVLCSPCGVLCISSVLAVCYLAHFANPSRELGRCSSTCTSCWLTLFSPAVSLALNLVCLLASTVALSCSTKASAQVLPLHWLSSVLAVCGNMSPCSAQQRCSFSSLFFFLFFLSV